MGAAPGCAGFISRARRRSSARPTWHASCHSPAAAVPSGVPLLWWLWLWVSAQRDWRTAASPAAEWRLRRRVWSGR